MNNLPEFPLYPNIRITKVGVKCRFNIFDYIPFTSAKICVVVLDDQDVGIQSRFFTIDTTNGFNEWGNDDSFLIKWLKEQMQK
jgi:hypothetical protein